MGFARESHRTYIGIRLSVFFLWLYHGNCVSLHLNNKILNAMAKSNNILVKDTKIRTLRENGVDYICITDIARQKNSEDPNGVIANWMRK